MENTLKELANASEKMNPIHAMRLLTKLFVDNCGVSLGYRSVAYCAIWDWLADVAPADIMPPLSRVSIRRLTGSDKALNVSSKAIEHLFRNLSK